MIIYMTLFTDKDGRKTCHFSGSTHQFHQLKRRLRYWGFAKVELKELHVSASDFMTIDTVEAL